MADSTLDSELFILFDTTPGGPSPWLSTPGSGFTNTTDHNVAVATYDLGTKIRVYNETLGVAGWSTFVYGECESQDGTNILAVKHLCGLDSTSTTPFLFTNEVASDVGATLQSIVVALSAMTTGRFGWFWCEGVVPEDYVAGLGGNFPTLGDVAIGMMASGDLATPGTTVGEIGFDLPDADTEIIVGLAYAADAA